MKSICGQRTNYSRSKLWHVLWYALQREVQGFLVFFSLPREFGLILSLLSRQNVAEVILGYFWAWPLEDWQLPTPLRKFPLRAWLLCCEEPLPQEARYRYSGPQDQQNSHDSLHQPLAMWWVILAIPSQSSGQNTASSANIIWNVRIPKSTHKIVRIT